MAKTVNSAFDEFNKKHVNLKTERTSTARSSRDWLLGQLEKLPEKVDNFPELYSEKHIKFGSFARNTKIKPLDDIDLIITFKALGATYHTVSYGTEYFLSVPDSAEDLKKLCGDDGYLSSIKVVNKLVSSLKEIEQYSSADLHRKQEAATLKLSSYEWNFDIVPSFYTDTEYYLIPDGNGNWKATDPRIDQDKTTTINKKHEGKVLQVIRTLKYWNRRASMPTIPSYLFENLVLNYFDSIDKSHSFVDENIISFWNYLTYSIFNSVADPKGFQGEINNLSYEDKVKISDKATDTYKKGLTANNFEVKDKDHEKAINKWREIFGDDFPKYE